MDAGHAPRRVPSHGARKRDILEQPLEQLLVQARVALLHYHFFDRVVVKPFVQLPLLNLAYYRSRCSQLAGLGHVEPRHSAQLLARTEVRDAARSVAGYQMSQLSVFLQRSEHRGLLRVGLANIYMLACRKRLVFYVRETRDIVWKSTALREQRRSSQLGDIAGTISRVAERDFYRALCLRELHSLNQLPIISSFLPVHNVSDRLELIRVRVIHLPLITNSRRVFTPKQLLNVFSKLRKFPPLILGRELHYAGRVGGVCRRGHRVEPSMFGEVAGVFHAAVLEK